MKKINVFSTILLASLMAVVSCNKEIDVENEVVDNTSKDVFTLTVNAGTPETKAVFQDKDGDSYPVKWSATGEAIRLAEVYTPGEGDPVVAAFPSTSYELTNSNATAKFSVSLTEKTAVGTYDYRAIYPSSAYTDVVPSYNDVSVVIPGTQTPTASSPDPAAIVLYAGVAGLDAQPTTTLDLDFSHITAYGKMTILNAGDAIGGGETIQSVSVSVPAGGVYYYWSNGNTVSVNATKTSEVVVNTDNLDTSGDFTAWFACKPFSLAIGDVLTVKITTDVATYVRPIILTKALSFTSGQVSKFSVNMASATPLIYSTAFNYPIVGSSYTSATPIEGSDPTGTNWYITYGNWASSNSAELRVYKAANYGVIYNDFDCSYVTNVFYDAKANENLKLNTYYSIDSGANWTKVDDQKTLTTSFKRYSFVVSATGAYPKVRIKFEAAGTAPTGSGNYALTIDNVEIYGKGAVILVPSITADNVSDVPAIGGAGKTLTYTIHNFTGADDVTAAGDGTVVVNDPAPVVSPAGTVTFTVNPNYSKSGRNTGRVTLTSPRDGAEKVVIVSQLGETFSASAETVTLATDATSGSFTITTPTFSWTAVATPAGGSNLTLTSSSTGSGSADPQTISFSCTNISATAEEQTLGTIEVYRNGNVDDAQKKTITIKKASTTPATTYTKVTSLTAGEKYLLVDISSAKIATGAISSNTLQSYGVTIASGTTITGNNTIDGYAMTITALTGDDAGYYTLKIGTKYIGYGSSGTSLATNTSVASDKYKWSISIDGETGLVTILNKNSTNRFIGWNGNDGWKAYSNSGSGYTDYPRPYLFIQN